MGPVLVRAAVITIGLAMIELSLDPVFARGSIGDWAQLALGVPLLVAGTAGFMGPLLGSGRGGQRTGVSDDA